MIVHLSVWKGATSQPFDRERGHHEYWNFKTEMLSREARNAIGHTVDRSKIRFIPDSPLPVDGAPPL